MAHVLIIGASKGIGLEAVRQSLRAGHRVRAFARSADRILLDDEMLEKRKGSALEPADVSSALEDVDIVIQALGVSAGPDMVMKPVRLFSQATALLIEAMEGAGVKRLICVTGFGAGDSRMSLDCLSRLAYSALLGRVYDDKSVQEHLIRKSDLDWTIARPVILTRGPGGGHYKVLLDPEQWRVGLISRVDVADFLIKQIEDTRLVGQTPVLTY